MSHGRMREKQASDIARQQARQRHHQGRQRQDDKRPPSEAVKRHLERMSKLHA